jgi:hypothetical protein
MTQPLSFLWRMLGFLALVLLVVALLHEELLQAFAANPVLNGVIAAVLLGGIAWNIRQVLLLGREVRWLEAFRAPRDGSRAQPLPRLLAPMASMLAARRSDRLSLSTTAMRSVLDGIESRLDETRELSRYMTGLLIFLGLLGTFWGLLLTISSVADVIGGMSVGTGDVNALFNQLKSGWRCRCGAWAWPSPPRCWASPGRLCWASSTSRRARRRTASTQSWKTGWPGRRASPPACWAATRMAAARCPPMSRRCWSRPPRTSKPCSR